MKTFLKIISAFLLAVSCLYFSISLFLSQLIIKDIIPSIASSQTVTSILVNVSDEALSSIGLNSNQTKQLVTIVQNDEEIQTTIENYVNTLFHDVVYQENTFNDNDILRSLESKKDVAYEVLQPDMTKDVFDQKYDQAIENINFQQMHQQIINHASSNFDNHLSLKNIVTHIYSFYHAPHIYIALILLIISTAYLAYSSIKENKVLSSCLMIIYILSGILTLLMAVMIVFVLSAFVSSTLTISISSIRYMYLCGGIYIFIGISGYLFNHFLRKI